ncbi:MAG TPA: sigma-70 family RNA polymerase sigma factor [Polyangiaceae bacterium]|nr:sigma-70 family RNA polymerase sigma factor [Polyangiaceae bacterium]
MTELLDTLATTRQRFFDLVAEVRPELHRYCTRMTGSVFDGEDVVQDTLAKAAYALAGMDSAPPLRPWLFRIAHNTALDFLRRYEHRNVVPTADIDPLMATTGSLERNEHAPDAERVELALEVFLALPPVQRSALALKDVLDLSLEDTAAAMGTSISAVKAALVRARANVAKPHTEAGARADDLERLRRYAALFNARDWDALRALFSAETSLEVVSRVERHGPAAAEYFTRYAEVAGSEALRLEAGSIDGVAVIAVYRLATSPLPAYFIQLDWRGDRVERVRDYRYVPYIAREARYQAG